MTASRSPGWLIPATLLLAAALVGVLLVLTQYGGEDPNGAQHTRPPYPAMLVRHGITYRARAGAIQAGSATEEDPTLLDVFVLDLSHGSPARCSGQYPTVGVVSEDSRRVTLRAADYVDASALPLGSGSVTCIYTTRLIMLRVRIDSPLGGRELWDDTADHAIYPLHSGTPCDDPVLCHS